MEPRVATFAAGCFWGVEGTFRKVAGVLATRVGYMGGTVDAPSYEQVCTGQTGHAEVCEVAYDPQQLGYEDLLAVFWSCHDPTTRDRQGPDVGSQYRSAVFWHDETQRAMAVRSLEALDASATHPAPVVTEVVPAGEFWAAEAEHQQYLEKGGHSGCRG